MNHEGKSHPVWLHSTLQDCLASTSQETLHKDGHPTTRRGHIDRTRVLTLLSIEYLTFVLKGAIRYSSLPAGCLVRLRIEESLDKRGSFRDHVITKTYIKCLLWL